MRSQRALSWVAISLRRASRSSGLRSMSGVWQSARWTVAWATGGRAPAAANASSTRAAAISVAIEVRDDVSQVEPCA